MPNINPKPNQAKDNDQKINEPNTFLKTQNEHKDWYEAGQMGKQRGKPQQAPREEKKKGGTRKHSLRKEK